MHRRLPFESPTSLIAKNRDSTAEIYNSSKCVKDCVTNGYVRDVHCSKGNRLSNCKNDPEWKNGGKPRSWILCYQSCTNG